MSTIFLDLPLIEWIGYGASTLVLISLSLSSIVKLRVYNLIGSALFSFYGFYIEALPVGIMNLIICFFNIYYLRTLLFKKEIFDGIWMTAKDEFVTLFVNRHMKDIQRFFPDFTPESINNCHILMAMRDMNVAGVFVTSQAQDGNSQVVLDYVTPQYRDYKTGRYLLKRFNRAFIDKGVNRLTSSTQNESHIKYLKNIGFRPTVTDDTYALELN
ncbi:hypothetical protein KDU71_06550 [Carboxylicivirga sediminis]|uniref:N-acetyltransferase domain-containing protein n=1 Tax=Carboxylicivirga sediminis TaxID=2006564 RepID=A0A941IXX6_9BACT|nr:GNAT family N-acetyltransferase [Carboxylicivirga sediminis]MBR8535212.1 hypothetical protein [Carboxylicivirga sediminis]